MRYFLSIALCFLAASPALAELPPYVYEQERKSATSVVVVDVETIGRLPRGQTQGSCLVKGRVAAVERGDAYKTGDHFELPIPCIGAKWQPMPGPFPGYQEAGLAKVRHGRFYIRNSRLVRRGFDAIEH